LVAVGVLVVAVGLEGYSFRTAMHEARPHKGAASWWQFIRTSRSPELPVVLLEDAGALVGLVLALAGVGLSVLTGDPVWDGVGTVGIGLLLGVIATVLIIEMQSLLIGEGATSAEEAAILQALVGGAIVRVIHCKTQYLGPDELMVAAKLAVPGQVSTAELSEAIDAAELRVRTAVPAARVIYPEPDLDRVSDQSPIAHQDG